MLYCGSLITHQGTFNRMFCHEMICRPDTENHFVLVGTSLLSRRRIAVRINLFLFLLRYTGVPHHVISHFSEIMPAKAHLTFTVHIFYTSLAHHLPAEEVAQIKLNGSSGAPHLLTDQPICDLFYLLWLLYGIANDDLTERPAGRQRLEMAASNPWLLPLLASQHQGNARLWTCLQCHCRDNKTIVTYKHINSMKREQPLTFCLSETIW